jgi:predicted RNase H-like HicB family nuclease
MSKLEKATFVYPAVIHKEPQSDYGVSFPDFPGCVTAGVDQADAAIMAAEALAFHIESMLADGLELPQPTRLEDLPPPEDSSELARMLVVAEIDAVSSPA